MNVDLHTIEICAGVGMLGEGLRAGLTHLGLTHRTVAYIEREAYAASVLAARMEDESLDGAPVWPDLLTFDGAAWRGAVDCIAAGFPCQDLSLAGRRAGLDGARSGLFFNIVDIADDCGARFLFLENVAGIASATASVMDSEEGDLDERAAARVLGELADRGWDAEWLTLSASEVGASHGRARWFCFAWRSVADTEHTTGIERHAIAMQWGRSKKTKQAGMGSSGIREIELGHPGLQHQHLQQRQDGAEHTGAGQPVACTQLPERRAISVCGDGGQQGHDSRRQETHGGVGIASEMVADTKRLSSQRRGITRDMARTGGKAEGEARQWQRGGFAADGGIGAVANPSSPQPQGHELRTTCDSHKGEQETHGPVSQLCGLFAPGPSNPRWAGIIDAEPWLTPAIDKATESLLCRAPDGLAAGLDFGHRAQRLKCVGNGVVALQAATAFVVLARRAGFMKKQLAPLVGKAQTAINIELEAA